MAENRSRHRAWNSTWTTSVAAGCVFLALAAGCSSSKSSGASASASGTKAGSSGNPNNAGTALTLHLGITVGETGPIASFGLPLANGARLAIDEANAENGGIHVDATFCDSQYKSNLAVTCGRRLQSVNKDSVVIGGTTLEAIPLLAFNNTSDNKFVLIAGTGSSNLVNQQNPLVARYFFNVPQYMKREVTLLTQAAKTYSFKLDNLGIMASNDEAGLTWANALQSEWAKLGKPSPTIAKYNDGTTDFTSQLTALIASKPDAIGLTQACSISAAIIKQAQQLGFKGRFIQYVACDPAGLATYIPESSFTGSLFEASNWSIPSQQISDFMSAYKAKFNTSAIVASTYGYAETWWAIKAAEAAKSTDPAKIRAAMPEVLTESAPWNLQKISNLQPNGEVSSKMDLAYVKAANNIVDIQ